MRKKLLFVVHRYAPFPGGSEYYVSNMAEEALSRGYDVTVLAGTNQGNVNGVKVTKDHTITFQNWDLIVVHGGDVFSQNYVLLNKANIKSPILYMLIKPSESKECLIGLRDSDILGYSTTADIKHIKKYGYLNKARRVRHGIPLDKTIKSKEKHPSKSLFVSVGGFWPHKGFDELSNIFTKANLPNTELHLYGYAGECPLVGKNIYTHFGHSQEDVLKAIACADVYILNSTEEGFGLVLLEAMANKTLWMARDIAGAHDMKEYGYVYTDGDELLEYFKSWNDPCRFSATTVNNIIDKAYDYVIANHTIKNTVDDIEDIINES